MTKYRNSGKNIGKKILAVALAVATIVTTGSFNMEALAANYSDAPSETIPPFGYIGQITTNTETTNQQVNSVEFKIVTEANLPSYSYTIKLYENPTDEDDPTTGVLRKTIERDIDSPETTKAQTISVNVGNGDDNKPIVLTKDEKLGVSIQIASFASNDTLFYDSEQGKGFTRANESSGWVERSAGTMLIGMSTYGGTLNDVDSITMAPENKVVTVGDPAEDLNISISPNYKREKTITSSSDAVTISNETASFPKTGEATVTATCAGMSTTATFYVLEPTVDTSSVTYDGTAKTKDVTVMCGTTKLTENKDYVVNYKDNVSPGTATLTITGRNNTETGKDYTGYSYETNFEITKGDVTQEMVDAGTFTVNTATGDIATASIAGLTYGRDYDATAKYKSSTPSSVTYDIIVTGKNNYSGGPLTRSEPVTMAGQPGQPVDINALVIAELDGGASFEYTGKDITPGVKFYQKNADGSKGADITSTFRPCVDITYDGGSSVSINPKTVTITGITDATQSLYYKGEMTLSYIVNPYNMNQTDTKVSVSLDKETWTHTGSEIKPTVTVKHKIEGVDKKLTEGTDYTLKWTNNTAVGTAKVTVIGAGNYKGALEKSFEIIANFKSDAEVTLLNSYITNSRRNFATDYSVTYNGNAHRPDISITLDGIPIEEGKDYSIVYQENTNAGTAKIHVTGNGIYAGEGNEYDVTFKITPKQMPSSVILNQQIYTYNGEAINIPDGEYDVYDGTTRLIPGTDYEVVCTNNTNVGTATITATGKGNYSGTATATYKIEPLSLTDTSIEVAAIPDETYNGAAHTPAPVVTHNGKTLVAGTDYTVSYSNNINVGTALVTITGKGNYKDGTGQTFKIKTKSLQNLEYKLAGTECTGSGGTYTSGYTTVYNGVAQKPSVEVIDNGVTLKEGTDYRLNYTGNVNAGTAYATLIGKGGYAGSGVSITFTITKKSLANCVVNFSRETEKRDGKTYPILEVRDPSASYGKDLLVENVDYTLVPEEAAATSGPNRKCSIVGKNNYMDEQEVYYDVGNNIASGTVNLLYPDRTQIQKTGDQYLVEYMGETPPIVNVVYNHVSLTEDTDYKVAFTPVSGTLYDAGSVVKVTVTGIGDYYGEATEQYTITRKAIDTMTLTDGNKSDWTYEYNSLKKEVNPVLTYNIPGVATPIELKAGTDFTVDKTEIGPNVTDSEIVTITATGNYIGTRTADYKINPFNINDIDDIIIDPIDDQKYTASAITPPVTVRHKLSDTSTIVIDPRSGYDVTYQNNTDVGEATVVITGKNNYYGTNTTRKFNIVRRPLTEDNTTITGLDNVFYDGTAKEPDITVIYAEPGTSGILLTEGEDYTVTYSDNTKIGPADKSGPKVHITGIGKYDGTVIEGFAIKGNIADTTIFTITGINDEYTISDRTITGITPLVTYKPGGVVTEIPSSYYTLKPPSTITPGNATVALEGNGDVMAGTYYKNIVLKGNLSEERAVTITGFDAVYDYTGSEIKPHPTVTYNGRTLVEGTDYKLEWQDNTNPGTGKAKVVVKPADGNTFYVGQASATFNIKYNLGKATISGINSSYEYKGSAWEPAPSVTIGTTTLSPGTDYVVTYANNENVGTATLTITAPSGSETTKGSNATTFKITPIAINNNNTTVVFNPAEIEFTGQPLQPLPTVTYSSQQLTINEDYLVEWPLDNKPGVKNVTVRGTGNYIGNVTNGKYTITPADISKATINVEDADYAGGQPVIPKYTISYNGIDLIKDGDYTVTCSNNEQVGTATITFTGKGCFTGSTAINFNVQQTDLSKGTVKVDGNSSIYTGSAIKPNIEVYIYTGDGDKKYTLKEKTSENPNGDYTISYNGFDEMVDAGDYEIIVQGEGNFVNKLYAAYKVEPKSLASDDIKITLDKEDWDYTGEEVKPSVVVTDNTRGVDLEPGVDYEIEYLNNTKAASKDGENAPTVRITGKGNYGEVVDKTFNIGSSLESATVTLSQYNYVYDGTEHKPTALAVLGTKDLVQGQDFELKYSPDDLIHVGEKTATLTGINGYYGEIPVTYNVNKKTASKDEIKIVLDYDKDEEGNYITVYNGKAKEPNVVVYDTTISEETPMLTSDYTVTYEHNTDVSTEENPAIVRVNLQGNYDKGLDEFNQKFYIKEKTLESGFEVAFKEHTTQYPYTGSAVEPEVEVIPTLPELVGKELVKDTDYTVEYTNNVNAGEATAIIKGIGNYTGVVEKKFNVVASFADADIQVEDQFYTGTEVKAPLTITCGGNTLVLGEDYDVNYWSDNNWETSATATITPLKPWYSGSARNVDYNIVFDPTMLTVSGYNNEYAYTGNPIKPDFVVSTPSGTSISYDPDAIKYVNSKTGEGDCTSIGTITATIPLNVGSKTCEVTATYDIIGKNINLCHIVPLYDNVYTGSKIYPPVLIWTKNPDGSLGELLTEGVDYTLKYSDNINPGVGKIEITGIGNYIATVTKYFNIIAPDVLSLSGSALSDTSVRLNWLRNAHITGYEIYSEDSSVKYGSTTGTSFDIGSLKQATNYTFKVRTFITVDGKTTYGAFKTVTVRTGLSAPTITVKSLARKRTTLNWTPAENVTGYEIYRSVSLNGTYNKIAVMPQSAGGYSDSNLVSGGTYYYKVRAYLKVGENQFVYGYFSAPKAVTVK